MQTLFGFVSGPLVWITFIVFIGGSFYRLLSMALLARKKDGVVYEYMDAKFAFRSILHWIIPFASANMRKNPVMTLMTFTFHICLILVPVFLFAHILLWNEAWGVNWWFLAEGLADTMTVAVIISCAFFLGRRLILPEVKYLTSPSDFVILAIVVLPFITGFWATHQWVGYRFMTILHILSGEIMLMAIPFTRLSHMLFFPFTRGYMGSEFGAVKNAKDW